MITCIYTGRFSPPTPSHIAALKWLGKYIAPSIDSIKIYTTGLSKGARTVFSKDEEETDSTREKLIGLIRDQPKKLKKHLNALDTILDNPITFEMKKKLLNKFIQAKVPQKKKFEVVKMEGSGYAVPESLYGTKVFFVASEKDVEEKASLFNDANKLTLEDIRSGNIPEVNSKEDKINLFITPKLTVKGITSATQVRKKFADGIDDEDLKSFYGEDYETLKDIIQSLVKSAEGIKESYSMDNKEEINKIIFESIIDRKVELDEVLSEGGAAGHLAHPYDIDEFDMRDLTKLIYDATHGKIKKYVTKTDGQNIFFSVKEGKVRFARNKTDLKNFGENSLTVQGLKDKFTGHANKNIEVSFGETATALEKAISKVPKSTLDRIFEEGKFWMNTEIMHPDTQNLIHYGDKLLMFHGLSEVDENGDSVGAMDTSKGTLLSGLISKYEDDFDFKMVGQHVIPAKPVENAESVFGDLKQKLNTFIRENNLDFNDTIRVYKFKRIGKWVKEKIRDSGIEFTDEQLTMALDRVINGNKVSLKLFGDGSKLIQSLEKEVGKEFKEAMLPLEFIFLNLGTIIMKSLGQYLTSDPNKSKQRIIDRVNRRIDFIKTELQKIKGKKDLDPYEQTIKKLALKLQLELTRLEASGGLKNVSPEEGLVFTWKNKLMKFTGLFASINQITNLPWSLPKDAEAKWEEYLNSIGLDSDKDLKD